MNRNVNEKQNLFLWCNLQKKSSFYNVLHHHHARYSPKQISRQSLETILCQIVLFQTIENVKKTFFCFYHDGDNLFLWDEEHKIYSLWSFKICLNTSEKV